MSINKIRYILYFNMIYINLVINTVAAQAVVSSGNDILQGGSSVVDSTLVSKTNDHGYYKDEESLPKHLKNNKVLSNLSGRADSEEHYVIQVQGLTSILNVTTFGGSGDVDLYVKHKVAPSKVIYDCRGNTSGNNESCKIMEPNSNKEGFYVIMLKGQSDYSGVSLLASFKTNRGGDGDGDGGDGDGDSDGQWWP